MKSTIFCLFFILFFTTVLFIKVEPQPTYIDEKHGKSLINNQDSIDENIGSLNFSPDIVYDTNNNDDTSENTKRGVLRYSGGLYGKRTLRYSGGLYGRKKRSNGILIIPFPPQEFFQNYINDGMSFDQTFPGTRARRALLIKRTNDRIVSRAMPMNGGLFGK
ncbi:Hypothetical protein SRAE_2000195600 [Strongyloides ratti]|uniref:Uncharacterized protein n=1 Tax=Strongyloides ratti TaxID=34506 RepID=A0A090LC10_STRRB|nr:Hypothetical protein SRAE_2000195600 [Strongyloides ratti]CEF67292.1 Hypothetical protein SRAE_2000195600 [Strongyloides ratti]